MEDQLENGCSEFKNMRIHYVSAKSFFKIDDIMDDVINAYSSWNTRITTNLLNKWTNQLKKISSIPNRDGEYLKLKFMTQIKTRPPSFSVFVNDVNIFFKHHETFLKKMMTKEFNLRCSPIRFLLRDHKKINEINSYKKVTVATAKIQKKIELLKKKLAKPTYRRKVTGYGKLYGNESILRTPRKKDANKSK
jgi:GTP-binding protein